MPPLTLTLINTVTPFSHFPPKPHHPIIIIKCAAANPTSRPSQSHSLSSKRQKKAKEEEEHPAFKKALIKTSVKLPRKEKLRKLAGEASVKVGDNGLAFVVPGAPFEFMYSYTETPKVKPLALRERPVSPFETSTMSRPWTGKKPLEKKKLPELDSFNPPPPGKKGVKSVQRPGPFLAGTGPKYVMSREQLLGEPLTKQEVKELVEGCTKTKRQLNMGRDGLTHNMLDNIHAHWKRRRVIKIKCKGVCTVDMDNVCQQLEEKTGGKILHRRGGIVYLFRGRNYNYKTRPRYPLMLWKPVTPIYPRLVKRAPEGLTLEEARDMRKRGRVLTPICKLGKNGVYINLVSDVREAFEACELVRINCQGMNPSDYKKIGGKLKDLVPCVLISFEFEHILIWRGRDWKSSISLPEDGSQDVKSSETESTSLISSHNTYSKVDKELKSSTSNISIQGTTDVLPDSRISTSDNSDVYGREIEDSGVIPPQARISGDETMLPYENISLDMIYDVVSDEEGPVSALTRPDPILIADATDELKDPLGSTSGSATQKEEQDITNNVERSSSSSLDSPCAEVLLLLRQAVENGSALVLNEDYLDADKVYERSVSFAKVAPPGPLVSQLPMKAAILKHKKQETGSLGLDAGSAVPAQRSKERKPKQITSSKTQKPKYLSKDSLSVVPQGTLKVDELADLLA